MSFAIILSVIMTVGCKKDLTSLNEDPKHPSSVPSAALFTNASANLSDLMASTNVNYNSFRLYVQYWTETTYTDEANYDINSRSVPDRWFATLYRDVIQDLARASSIVPTETLLSEGEIKNRLAINDILITYSYYTLITTFGNVPYTDALLVDSVLQPKYDDAASIFDAISAKLDNALGSLDASAGGYGSSDIILNGDVQRWITFGNCLKMRMGMLIADVDPTKASAMVLAASPNVINSNEDNLAIQYVSSPPNTNPVWEDLIQSGRHDFVAAATIIDTMKALNDPRLPFYFKPYNGEFVGQPYATGGGAFSDPSDIVASPTNPFVYFSYAEMEFLKAEAVERGIAVGGTAAEHYGNGVLASITEWGGTQGEAEAYLAQPDVAYATAAGNWKQKIGYQAWLAYYNRGYDAWTEWRRLDYPVLSPGPEALTDIPVRYTYPVLEQNLNTKNYEAASDAIGGDDVTTKLFWDKY
jgi:hypothetical protein